ncbi:MAG TPA: DUF4294 domain-containing protein [Bacteroidales bacterium]|nr:DUF4294 domain-containing protein [Bacteroidales bacterium]HPT09577.1 DUF4294 domain-containing protein [Bacteroidales bacterium]
MWKGLFTIGLILVFIQEIFGQDTTRIQVPAELFEGDTLALVTINPVMIFPPVRFATKRQSVRYDRLVYNVKKVYPFAKLAGAKLKEYKTILEALPNEIERKAFTKKAEKELENQFGDEIKELTFSQGKILIKLIYRETGNSTFDIIKDLRGGFSAFIWQTLARIFGYNLKSMYEPDGHDQAIEQIVLMIEAGAI